ncbi:MAG: type IV secretion system protein [Thermoleophilia bacterium]
MPRRLALLLAGALAAVALALGAAGASAPPAQAGIGLPSPCDLPIVDGICGVIGGVADAAGDAIMRGVTSWVTNAAVWVTGKVGALIEATTTPDLSAGWFESQYGAMVAVAGSLALLLLVLSVVQAVMRQDVNVLLRSAFGYLPLAFVLAAAAAAATGLLVAVSDGLASTVVHGLGTESDNLLQAVGDAYKHALDESGGDAIPLFGIFLGAIVLAIGAFVLWIEMVIRDASIYICVFFLPLTFVAMVWPATGRWARRLVELLVAIVLAKFVIVAILSLASAAITGSGVTEGDGNTFERMIAGAALLVLAAWSPFALLRLVPMMESAAGNVLGQRAAAGRAAGAVGVQSPAAYVRQAIERSSRQSSSQRTRSEAATVAAAAGAYGGAAVAGSRPRRDAAAPPGGGATGGGARAGTAPGDAAAPTAIRRRPDRGTRDRGGDR